MILRDVIQVVAGAHSVFNPDGTEQILSLSDAKVHSGFIP
jgi:hypothetical protein